MLLKNYLFPLMSLAVTAGTIVGLNYGLKKVSEDSNKDDKNTAKSRTSNNEATGKSKRSLESVCIFQEKDIVKEA